MRFLRIKQLQEKLGIKRSTIYQKISKGLLPPPRRWGNVSVWVEEEVEKVMEAVIRGKTDDEIRKIVESFTKN